MDLLQRVITLSCGQLLKIVHFAFCMKKIWYSTGADLPFGEGVVVVVVVVVVVAVVVLTVVDVS